MGAGIGKIGKEEKSVKDPEVWRRIKMPAVRGRVEGGGQGAGRVTSVDAGQEAETTDEDANHPATRRQTEGQGPAQEIDTEIRI